MVLEHRKEKHHNKDVVSKQKKSGILADQRTLDSTSVSGAGSTRYH